MQKFAESKKLIIMVLAGILLGAFITITVQKLFFSEHGTRSEQQASDNSQSNPNSASDKNESTEAAGTADPKQADAEASATAAPSKTDKYASPTPALDALAALNNGAPAPAPQAVVVPAGQAYSQTSSGYPIYTGGRAIDSTAIQAAAPMPMQGQDGQIQSSQYVGEQNQPAPQAVGRNGLLTNPCVDPISVHGLAYRQHYN